jgi:hypothetical protein
MIGTDEGEVMRVSSERTDVMGVVAAPDVQYLDASASLRHLSLSLSLSLGGVGRQLGHLAAVVRRLAPAQGTGLVARAG